jgi:hypothetical protein
VESASCAEAAAWLADALLLDHDLFAGRQHALKMLDQVPPPAADLHVRMNVD